MAKDTERVAGEQLEPSGWVLVVTKAGVHKGMVGLFPTQDDAETWAVGLLEGERSWTWRSEPVVSPASLPEPAGAGTPCRRPHLTLVR